MEPPLRKAIEIISQKKCPKGTKCNSCYECEYNILLCEVGVDIVCIIDLCKRYIKQHKNDIAK